MVADAILAADALGRRGTAHVRPAAELTPGCFDLTPTGRGPGPIVLRDRRGPIGALYRSPIGA